VAGADGVVAVGLEQLDLALLGAVDGGGAERAVVVVDAAALQLERLAVEPEAVRGMNSSVRMPKEVETVSTTLSPTRISTSAV
jgi:hypothetical protein